MPASHAVRIHDRYTLFAELASGGMATVHIGRLLGPVGFSRTVAIKRLRPEFAGSTEFRRMFVDEARLAARVRHPNVVQTIDVVAQERELFVVMDYVHGESLSRLLKATADGKHALPSLGIVATIVSSVLHGLQAAHEAKSDRGAPLGIIHRDVSPQNIIVGADGISRVLDFGVAKAGGRLHTTREGRIKGKLAYMAPEQLEGAPTQQTDVYATAVVLWEALTGRRLFAGDGGGVISRIMEGTISPPSAHRRSIPADLDELVLRGLARDPSRRFASARDMALALERCVGVVPPSDVGAWVHELQGRELDQRAALIARIEESSSAPSDQFRVPLLSDTIRERSRHKAGAKEPRREGSSPDDGARRSDGSGRAEKPPRAEEPSSISSTTPAGVPSPRRSKYLVLGGALVFAAWGAVALLRMRGSAADGAAAFGLVSSPNGALPPSDSTDAVPETEGQAQESRVSPRHRGKARPRSSGGGIVGVIQAPDEWDPGPLPSTAESANCTRVGPADGGPPRTVSTGSGK